MERKIYSYFGKRPNSGNSPECTEPKTAKKDDKVVASGCSSGESSTSSASKKTSAPTASVKTVKKWETELNISLIYDTSDTDKNTVVKIWCAVCKDYSKDASSNVSFAIKVLKVPHYFLMMRFLGILLRFSGYSIFPRK